MVAFFLTSKHAFNCCYGGGLFRVLPRVGVAACPMRYLRSFCQQLCHRFRYGQVDGSEWFMANELAHCYPASVFIGGRLRRARAWRWVMLALLA